MDAALELDHVPTEPASPDPGAPPRFKGIAHRVRPYLPSLLRTAGSRLLAWPEDRKFARLAAGYALPGGFERIYCFHVRKTGGTSLHQTFLAASGGEGAALERWVYRDLNTRLIHNGLAYAAHNRTVIEAGRYFYAWSHRPWHELSLPPATFRVTVLRDPVQRVVSHYRMLVGIRQNGEDPGLIQSEGGWIGASIDDFLERAPKSEILRQLYMFSASYDIGEAAEHIQRCEFVFLTERYSEGLAQLSRRLGLDLRIQHARRAPADVKITAAQRARLVQVLEPEYRLLARIGLDTRVRGGRQRRTARWPSGFQRAIQGLVPLAAAASSGGAGSAFRS